jgi:hypothetical protein
MGHAESKIIWLSKKESVTGRAAAAKKQSSRDRRKKGSREKEKEFETERERDRDVRRSDAGEAHCQCVYCGPRKRGSYLCGVLVE